MKRFIPLLLLTILTACTTQAVPQNDYADIEQRLHITFLDNPDTPKNMCNPIIEAAYKSSEQSMPLDITLHVNVHDQREVGLVMLPTRTPDLLIGRTLMSPEGDINGTCKQMHLRLSKLQCWNANGTEHIDCPPSKRTDGLRMFGYVGVNY